MAIGIKPVPGVWSPMNNHPDCQSQQVSRNGKQADTMAVLPRNICVNQWQTVNERTGTNVAAAADPIVCRFICS